MVECFFVSPCFASELLQVDPIFNCEVLSAVGLRFIICLLGLIKHFGDGLDCIHLECEFQ